MVLYGITLLPLREDIIDTCPNLLSPFYADDTVFHRSARHNAAQLHLVMDGGTDQVYLPKPAKYLFIAETPEGKEVAKREFNRAGLNLSYVDGRRYVGGGGVGNR